jgi:hypothetical protein
MLLMFLNIIFSISFLSAKNVLSFFSAARTLSAISLSFSGFSQGIGIVATKSGVI